MLPGLLMLGHGQIEGFREKCRQRRYAKAKFGPESCQRARRLSPRAGDLFPILHRLSDVQRGGELRALTRLQQRLLLRRRGRVRVLLERRRAQARPLPSSSNRDKHARSPHPQRAPTAGRSRSALASIRRRGTARHSRPPHRIENRARPRGRPRRGRRRSLAVPGTTCSRSSSSCSPLLELPYDRSSQWSALGGGRARSLDCRRAVLYLRPLRRCA